MKKISFLLLCAVVIFSCSKDDGECSADDFVGTYSADGTSCLLVEEGVTLSVTKSGDDNVNLRYNGPTGQIEFNGGFPITGCSFTQNITDTSTGSELTITVKLDGKKLNISFVGSAFGNSIDCSETFKK